jgi:uncharacterized membrane protein (DUF4010 family)
MDFQELATRLGLALGIGLLIGLERGWRLRDERPGMRTAGIRTFTISGVLGGVTGALAVALGGGVAGGIAVGVAFAAYAAAMAAFCLQENRIQNEFSATTWVAAVLTFALGAYAILGDMTAAAGLAVATALMLAMREPLHDWVQRLTWRELRSALVLLAMTFIALPIMPDHAVGPFGGINPREVWLIAIALAGVSFAGYIGVKYLGATHGVLLASAAGGLVSSTAVTITNARRAASGEGSLRLLAAGVSIASTIMFLRVCGITLALNTSLFAGIAPPLLAAAATSTVYALILGYWKAERVGVQETRFRNPFAFWTVIGFAAFLALVMVAARIASERLGSAGAIVGAAIIGLVDVDAITVSLAKLAPQSLSYRDAANAILLAVVTDTISKIGIGVAIGRGRFALDIAIMAIISFAVGGAVYAINLSLG